MHANMVSLKYLNVWVWLLCLLLFITHANSKDGGNHPDFISIDCGSSYGYPDYYTGIWYDTDKDYVETGRNHMISSSDPSLGQQFTTVRSFPEGVRNCYTLKPKQGKDNTYLIRALFAYGNYDQKNEYPSFDVFIGVNYWGPIKGQGGRLESIHTPSTDTIQVCLVKRYQTVPYISSLELRPLNNSIYQIPSSSNQQPLLNLVQRFDAAGSSVNLMDTRYKDDVYDRIWHHQHDILNATNGWYPIFNESLEIDAAGSDYKLPIQVLRSAAQSSNVSLPLNFDFNSVFPAYIGTNFEYQVFFHFAEIEERKKRIMNITLNSKAVLPKPLALEYWKPVTISPKEAAQGEVSFSITATSESDAPPLLNAFEIYQLITNLDSPSDTRDVGAIVDIKKAYNVSKLSWQGDPCLPKEYAWEGLNCSSDTNPRITSLNLSSSRLKGEINTSFSYLTELEFLDLSDNNLEGPLPEFLAELPKLKVLNLRGNKFSGPIPKALKEKADTTLQLSVTVDDDLRMSNSRKMKNFVLPLVASLSACVVILLIALGFWMIKKRQKVMRSDFHQEGSLKSKQRAFSYSEILNITHNFKTIIGEGGFGKVYFGVLNDRTQVAVKLLSPSSMQGYKEFESEAKLLMIVHHRNLVSLIGYCDEGEIKALIYEFMANGNVQQHLSVNNPNVLKWNDRLIIAVDAAQGLDYLHNGCKPPLVHRDLKPSNILLDQNMHGKIADFGLCRAFGNDIDSHISTRPAGTLGYVDPEFQRTGNSNKKSDIYSFGIILFELITGQQALVRAPGITIHILEWAIPLIEKGDIRNIVDLRLQEEFNINSAWKAAEIALSCVSPSAAERPDISEILADLKECLSLEMVHRHTERARTFDKLTSLQIESEIAPLAR